MVYTYVHYNWFIVCSSSIHTYIYKCEGIRSACCDYYENIYIADEDLRVRTSRISKFMLLTLNKTLFSYTCVCALYLDP